MVCTAPFGVFNGRGQSRLPLVLTLGSFPGSTLQTEPFSKEKRLNAPRYCDSCHEGTIIHNISFTEGCEHSHQMREPNGFTSKYSIDGVLLLVTYLGQMRSLRQRLEAQ